MDQKKERSLIKKLFVALLPLQAVAVGLPAVNDLINSLIIGSALGPTATAAIGFAGPYTLFVSAISSLLSAGSQLVCGRNLGNGDKKGIRAVYTTTLTISTACGLIVTLITLICPDLIVKLLGVSGDSAALTAVYIKGIGLGAIFTIIIACLIPFLQINNSGNICTITVIVQLVFNIGGTLLTVHALDGGLFGVGLSTSAANLAATLTAFLYLQISKGLFKFDIKAFDLKTIKPIVYSGAPNSLGPVCCMVRDVLINSMVYALGGTLAVAAKAVAASLSTSVGSFLYGGYVGAGRIIGSVLVGEKDSSSLRDLPKTMVESGWYLFVGAYVLVVLIARPIAGLYVSSPEEISLYVSSIWIYNLWFITCPFKNPALAIYQAMDKVKESTVLMVLNEFVFGVLAVWILSPLTGFPGVLLFGVIAEILVIILMAVMFTVQAHRLPRSVYELCYIPNTLSAPREDRFKAVVSTETEACEASKDIIRFCKEKGIDGRRIYYAGLAVEEILTFIIKNRFTKKDDVIDVRAIYSDGNILILIRDSCKEFDMVKWLDLCNPEDQEKSVGIRMVKDFSKDMNYMSTLGLNVLNIRL